MSKLIKMTPEYIEEVRKEFDEALSSSKFADGKINFTKTFTSINRKATIFFTEIAWLKMQTLVREFDKEVAWHGITTRGEDEAKDEYYITDILVYPQEVTGSTVNTDQEKYQMWLMNHDDDVFNNIRMQGHSHVNMGTTPSGVDTSLYERILEQLDDDMFYIFMIWNKKKEKTIKIYDLAKNIMFETKDVTVEVMDDSTGVEQFLKGAKEMVVDKPNAYFTTAYRGNNYSGYGGHGSSYSGCSGFYGDSAKKEEPKAPVIPITQGSGKKKKGKRKGKRHDNTPNVGNASGAQSQLTIFNSGDGNNDWGEDYGLDSYYNRY